MKRVVALVLVGAFFLIGCGKDEPTPPAPPQHPNHPPGGGNGGGNNQEWVLNPETAGTISGTIKLDGKPPKRKEINMGGHDHCQKNNDPIYSESVVVGPNGGLKNCFVYIKKGLENYKFVVPAEPVVLDQYGCIYKPHVLGVVAGQRLLIQNSDNADHNVHGTPRLNFEWNFSQRPHSQKEIVLAIPEIMVFVKCDVHAWMGSYIGVLPHSFYAVTDDESNFTLPPLNPGHYELEVWHEKYGTQNAHVQLDAKGKVVLNLKYSAVK